MVTFWAHLKHLSGPLASTHGAYSSGYFAPMGFCCVLPEDWASQIGLSRTQDWHGESLYLQAS